MTGLHRTARKALPKEGLHFRMARKVNKEMENAYSSFTPEVPESNEPVIPMADEEEIKRSKRRGTSARGGGRAATILTGGDKDRLGG